MGVEQGDFVELRGRPWLVEAVNDAQPDLTTLKLSCIADDAQGEQIEVLWDAEIGARVLNDNPWAMVGRGTPDSPEVLAAYVKAIRWKSATAADRDLLQAPFRAGIRLDAYQLLPLRKALRLPRVNLLIADDVGLGKTIEAGLVMRELLLRRRIDFIVISSPAAMTAQWKDELESKFGLTFDIIDRARIGELRRLRGFNVNPWATGSRFILSHSLLADEEYVAGLRDLLGEFRPRALFILDEAHHAAPSGGARYAIASQLTKAVRDLSERFEHRLFLTATPHNGHSNSFSAMLEMLDPQRFTRGVEIAPKDLAPVMVRRLKADLRRLGEAFPERCVEAVPLAELPSDTPELDLWVRLAAYGALRQRRIATLPPQKAALAKLALVGLQQRLLSSAAAFLRTLKAHRKTLQRIIDGDAAPGASAAAAFVDGSTTAETGDLGLEDADAEDAIDRDEEATAQAATVAGASGASAPDLRKELAAVDEMLALAEDAARKPDARVRWLVKWIKANMLSGSTWNTRRLIIFTEWEDTRRWLEKRLREALAETDGIDARIDIFTGATGEDRRKEVKAAFNADPTKGAAAHPPLHRRGARRHQPADLLPRPRPFRSAVESLAPGAAQRPHRSQAAAGQESLLPLFSLRAARGRHRARGARAQDRGHRAPARLGRPVDREADQGPARPGRHRSRRGDCARQGDRRGNRRRAARARARRDGRRGAGALRARAGGAAGAARCAGKVASARRRERRRSATGRRRGVGARQVRSRSGAGRDRRQRRHIPARSE
jgi:hypothetical protein